MVYKIEEAAQVNEITSIQSAVGVGITVLQYFAYILQCLQDSALAGAVGAEQQGNRSQLDTHTFAHTLEVFQFDSSQAGRRIIIFTLTPGGRVEELEETGQRFQ